MSVFRDLKGAAAMTDPNDNEATEATSDGELSSEVLDAVSGGGEDFNYTWNLTG
jgi:hypothetical protein